MIGFITRQLETEISLYRCADVRRATVVDGPATVLVLVAKNVVGTFLEALLVASAQKSVHQDVIGFKGGICFELSAPVAIFVLLGQKPFARCVDSRGYATG